jgi:endonuclease YncB( thermonuclease family)
MTIFALIASLVMSAAAPDLANEGVRHAGKVIRVVDGDSLYLEGQEIQIRLFGVDAPEQSERGY